MHPTTTADVCVAACADLFSDDGETLVNTIGVVPAIGARLARLTTAPDLVLHDGASGLLRDPAPIDAATPELEGWMPIRRLLDVVSGGRRHAVMGANQMDAYGNQNIAAIGRYDAPSRLLAGFRGAPGNTVNHRVSYWVPRHCRRVFTRAVDVVCGIGGDRAATVGAGARFHAPHRVVTDLAVLDFTGPGATLRLRSVHPGVAVTTVVERTGFPLQVDGVAETRAPTAWELELIDWLDPSGRRADEVPDQHSGAVPAGRVEGS